MNVQSQPIASQFDRLIVNQDKKIMKSDHNFQVYSRLALYPLSERALFSVWFCVFSPPQITETQKHIVLISLSIADALLLQRPHHLLSCEATNIVFCFSVVLI